MSAVMCLLISVYYLLWTLEINVIGCYSIGWIPCTDLILYLALLGKCGFLGHEINLQNAETKKRTRIKLFLIVF